MKVEYDLTYDGTQKGKICLRMIPETDFEKSFISRNSWESFMMGCPIVSVEDNPTK